jgi:hypothetical protein
MNREKRRGAGRVSVEALKKARAFLLVATDGKTITVFSNGPDNQDKWTPRDRFINMLFHDVVRARDHFENGLLSFESGVKEAEKAKKVKEQRSKELAEFQSI